MWTKIDGRNSPDRTTLEFKQFSEVCKKRRCVDCELRGMSAKDGSSCFENWKKAR